MAIELTRTSEDSGASVSGRGAWYTPCAGNSVTGHTSSAKRR